MGITASKIKDFSDWYTQVVQKAKLADYAPVKGLIVLRPDGYSIWESLKTVFDKKFATVGVRNAFLPILIPESLLGREKKHFAGFNPEVFWVTHSGNNLIGDRLALRPTSETLAYTMYAKWIQSWRDLPLKINFWNTALRAEIKATKPFLRTSEFLWQEGHTVHATQKEAEDEVIKMLEIYRTTVEEELAIPVITGKKSENEKFVGSVYTTTMEAIMPDGKALQMGTSHFLGQHFSKPFDVKFSDKDNVEHFAWQTSWGVSWRLIGAMIMVHGDDQGLVLPPRVAPIQAVIVPIYRSGDQKDSIMGKARLIFDNLTSIGIRVHLDDRDGFSPGYKFNDWEMKGVPIRIEIGPRDIKDNFMQIAQRHDHKKYGIGIESAYEILKILEKIQSEMYERAIKQAELDTFELDDYSTLKSRADKGGFFVISWCGDKECEKQIKDDTGMEIRVIPFNNTIHGTTKESTIGKISATEEDADGQQDNTAIKCILCCGRRAKFRPVLARGY